MQRGPDRKGDGVGYNPKTPDPILVRPLFSKAGPKDCYVETAKDFVPTTTNKEKIRHLVAAALAVGGAATFMLGHMAGVAG